MFHGDEAQQHEERLATARHAAEQVAAWQAQLVASVESLMETPIDDSWGRYLAWALGLTSSEARELVELVDRLTELPRTRQVLASGERSFRTVLAVARRATPANEETILTSTEAFTGSQLERTLREFAKVVAPSDREGAEAEEDEPAPLPSSASWGWQNGRFRLRADLDEGDGAALQAWLEAERAKVEDVDGERSIVPGYNRSCAEALVSLGERAADLRTTSVGFAPETVTTNLVVHAHEGADGALLVDRAFIPGAGPVPRWAVGMLVERGPVVTTLMVRGEPIMATTPTRFATADQRRALLARDGGCAYPGCGAARRLIAHHIRYFDDGGPTELRNMVLLCRRHHRVVHQHSVSITPEPDAPPDRLIWRFSDKAGKPMSPTSPGLLPTAAERLETRQRRTGDGDPLTLWGLDVTIAGWLAAA